MPDQPTATQLPAPAPIPDFHTKPYWDATAEGRLMLPKCDACATIIWYPRQFCPSCGSTRVTWVQASGRGTVYSYTVNHMNRADLPEYRGIGPYVLAYVELEEGPRLLTNIVDCNPGDVRVGQAVELVFHDTGQGSALPRFRPAAVREG